MASTRKSSGTPSNEAAVPPDDKDRTEIEDAIVLGEDMRAEKAEVRHAPAVEETAPEASSEISGSEEVRREAEPLEDRPSPGVDEHAAPEEPPARPAPVPPPRGGGSIVLPLVFGGVIAALAGVGAARFVFPDGWPGRGDSEAVLAELRTANDAQTARIAELEAALAALRDEVAATPDPSEAIARLEDSLSGQVASSASEAAARIGDLGTQLGDLDTQLGALSSRVEDLAMRPVPEGLDPASLDAELSRFQGELSAAVEEARAGIVSAQEEAAAIASRAAEEAAAQEAAAAEEAEATRAAAEAAAAAAVRDAALTRILAALDSGEPYADSLAALGTDVPEALATPAPDGVPTLAALAESFPDAARAALDTAIRADAGDDAVDRLTAFLRVQTGARSLEPREGTDPDAVLSRAEAAVRAGNLTAALSEIASLPEAGQAAMAGWTQAARTRLQALEAAQGLSQQ